MPFAKSRNNGLESLVQVSAEIRDDESIRREEEASISDGNRE